MTSRNAAVNFSGAPFDPNRSACTSSGSPLVSCGNASGKPDPLDVLELGHQSSLFLTRPRLHDYTSHSRGFASDR